MKSCFICVQILVIIKANYEDTFYLTLIMTIDLRTGRKKILKSSGNRRQSLKKHFTITSSKLKHLLLVKLRFHSDVTDKKQNSLMVSTLESAFSLFRCWFKQSDAEILVLLYIKRWRTLHLLLCDSFIQSLFEHIFLHFFPTTSRNYFDET